ncbi:MAG: hypothetical protein DRP82_07540 [Planctomycetota bacterium]|nr:MAG: hypothetical protein DRP82_07540 [Planctomycetota bacterium]
MRFVCLAVVLCFGVVVLASERTIRIYAIRARKVEKKKAALDPSLQRLEKVLRLTGYNSFELLESRSIRAEKGRSATLSVGEANLKIECSVESSEKRIRVRLTITQIEGEERTVVLDALYVLKEKPLLVEGVRLKRGRLIVVIALGK